MPLIEYYRKQNKLATVSGEGSVSDVGTALAAVAGRTVA
jgi:adenylate kinase family enzyme